MPDFDYQLIVIGSGPGGYVAAIRASQLGLKTAIVEKDKTLGGTCLNVGCIPSKALLASTEYLHFAKERFAAHGIIASDIKVDLGTMMKRKGEVVGKLTGGVAYLMKKNKIEVVKGLGRLVDANTVEVTDEGGAKKTLKAQNILLATGSVPVELPFLKFDGKRVISSDQGIALVRVPKTMLIIGAGAIGLELGSVWARLGAEVTVIEFLPRIAAVGFDAETSKILQRNLEKLGMKFELSTKIESARVTDKSVELQGVQGDKKVSYSADLVLVAVGRKPFTTGLDLDKAGVKLTEKSRIAVNDHWQTSVPSIYSIGDVIDGPMLAHKAHEEGVAVAERLAGKPGHVNYNVIPGIIYTAPEAASVGLTEEEAKEKGIAVKVGKFAFTANGRAIASDTTEGFVKIIADAKTDRVLGAHIVAGNASELIAETVLLMEYSGSSEDLARTIHAHPTMSEAVKEAALAVDGRTLRRNDMQVEHIAWQVPDPVALAEWYIRNLGFRVVRRGSGPSLAHFLADSSGRVVIEVYNNPEASIPDYPAMNPLILHLAFAVPDIAGTRDRLVKAGATIAEDIKTTHAGDDLAMLRDPWGFPIQLVKRVQPMI